MSIRRAVSQVAPGIVAQVPALTLRQVSLDAVWTLIIRRHSRIGICSDTDLNWIIWQAAWAASPFFSDVCRIQRVPHKGRSDRRRPTSPLIYKLLELDHGKVI
jgi:hypothetical protein